MAGITSAAPRSLRFVVAVAFLLAVGACGGGGGEGGGGGGGNPPPSEWTVTWSAPGQDISEWEAIQVVKNTKDRIQSMSAPAGGVDKAFKFTVLENDQLHVRGDCGEIMGGWRAEGTGPHERESNRPIRYEWNTWFEKGFPVPPVDRSMPPKPVWVVFTQWHQKDPANSQTKDVGSSPPIEFIIEGGMLKLHLNSVDRARPNDPSVEFAKADLAPVNPGTWHHWRADIRWSGTDGSVKVWHDDVLKYDSKDLKVQTIFPDPHSLGQPGDSYLKVGLYRDDVDAPGPWVVWHDEFKRLEQGNAAPLPHPHGKLPNCLTATETPSIN